MRDATHAELSRVSDVRLLAYMGVPLIGGRHSEEFPEIHILLRVLDGSWSLPIPDAVAAKLLLIAGSE